MQCLKFSLLLLLFLTPEPTPARKANTVETWATNLGDELWRLSESLTKSAQIRGKYKQMNASVKKKEGKLILKSSLSSVSTMLLRKSNAVKCIHATAEKLAQRFVNNETENKNFKYCSAKYSKFSYEDENYEPEQSDKWNIPEFAEKSTHYKEIALERDSHFYYIYVNTNNSCVHVPTNIYYLEKDAMNAILWSKELNDVFIQNYKSDPSLSWQYFGSSHGVLRFYPGMPWNKMEVDTYDCRVRSWYIEAATCSKDVIILFDVSGSMTGFKNYVARRTLRSLLDTLSNNDYVNVYTFNKEVKEVIKCFKGLIQATRENLNTLRDKLEPWLEGKTMKHAVKLEGNANLTEAYRRAFETLKERRLHQHCDVTSNQGCNQLVMVITDYVPGNLTEVFEEHNREVVNDVTYIPVRVFTYLIGKEVTNVQEIQWMACLNRGYFVHIHSVEEVQQQVLKYINVIARPMILEGKEPPPTWTHANIDDTRTRKWSVSSSDIDKPDEDKLVTSVAIPAFDYVGNEEQNSAVLLGVAGTDVPIDSIAKLAQPHQLGVNGYSFIVSNNGYILLHPLLITTINGELQENYNSVDFTEVEQVDDGKQSRELGDQIKELREHLVNGDEGKLQGIKVLYHYDQMRRIARVQHDYFYDMLQGTPFSMGISLPRGYGDTELLLKDNPLEAKQGKDVTGVNVTDFFRSSFRVHPDWVYCKYHYLEGHEADNPEMELWRFLVSLSHNRVDITKKQYSEDFTTYNVFNFSRDCGNTTLRETEDYYCNEDLVKQLVFDAKLTTPYFEEWKASDEERALAEKYNVSVRFIATSSGLTRWDYIIDKHKNEKVNDTGHRQKVYNGSVFGDSYITAIEETWYKAAVLQHMIDKDTLVIATRLPILDNMIEVKTPVENEDGDISITASYAIFYKDGDSETPASVVGFQYSFKSFYERFLNLTESARHGDEDLSCNSTDYNCYVVDSSGYVVLSKEKSDVGQFFGVTNKYVLHAFVENKIFEHVEVYNYQAICPVSLIPPEPSRSWSLISPFTLARNFLGWLMTEAIFMMSNVYNWNDFAYAATLEDKDYNDEIIKQASTEMPTTPKPARPEADIKAKEKQQKPFSCDHQISLYYLNQSYFLAATGASVVVGDASDCHPAYWATYIPRTNLLLVVVENDDRMYDDACPTSPTTKPEPTGASTDKREPCHKLDLGRLHRKKLEGCYTYHEGEKNITLCGIGSNIRADTLFLATSLILGIIASKLILRFS